MQARRVRFQGLRIIAGFYIYCINGKFLACNLLFSKVRCVPRRALKIASPRTVSCAERMRIGITHELVLGRSINDERDELDENCVDSDTIALDGNCDESCDFARPSLPRSDNNIRKFDLFKFQFQLQLVAIERILNGSCAKHDGSALRECDWIGIGFQHDASIQYVLVSDQSGGKQCEHLLEL